MPFDVKTPSGMALLPWKQVAFWAHSSIQVRRADPERPEFRLIKGMCKPAAKLICNLFLICALPAADVRAQQGQQAQSGEGSAYGSKFFDQLSTIFGRFRDADLQRVFREAQPIQCSELAGRKGEWRTVAFFNEDRKLGSWYRESLEDVKADLSLYIFKGNCRGDQGRVQVVTEYPTAAGMEAYRQNRIPLELVDITLNDPVEAVVDPRTMAYTFVLPYLFLTERNPAKIYSLNAPDRYAAYAPDVASRWECKAVASKDVTYRFLICRTATIPRGAAAQNQDWKPSFGSSAFFVLSDGTEAKTSVQLSFGDVTGSAEKSPEETPDTPSPARPALDRKK
jgi:hypothetical protein